MRHLNHLVEEGVASLMRETGLLVSWANKEDLSAPMEEYLPPALSNFTSAASDHQDPDGRLRRHPGSNLRISSSSIGIAAIHGPGTELSRHALSQAGYPELARRFRLLRGVLSTGGFSGTSTTRRFRQLS